MTDYIALGMMLLTAAMWAQFFAHMERDIIAQATITGNPVDHGELLMWRVIILGAAWLVVVLGAGLTWAAIPLATLTWAAFTMLHRFLLNRMREHFPWWYVSTSNVYDRFWLGLTGGRVKAAGIAAYCFEITTLAASVGAYIWIVNT